MIAIKHRHHLERGVGRGGEIAAHVVESAVMAAGYNHKQDSFTAVANHANQIRRALTKAGLPAWAIDAAMDAAKKASDFRDGRARKVSSGPIVASLRQNGFILDEQVAPDDPAARLARMNRKSFEREEAVTTAREDAKARGIVDFARVEITAGEAPTQDARHGPFP